MFTEKGSQFWKGRYLLWLRDLILKTWEPFLWSEIFGRPRLNPSCPGNKAGLSILILTDFVFVPFSPSVEPPVLPPLSSSLYNPNVTSAPLNGIQLFPLLSTVAEQNLFIILTTVRLCLSWTPQPLATTVGLSISLNLQYIPP